MQNGSKVELRFQIKQLETQNDELKESLKKFEEMYTRALLDSGDLSSNLYLEKENNSRLLEMVKTLTTMLLEK